MMIFLTMLWSAIGLLAIRWYCKRHKMEWWQISAMCFYAVFFGPVMWLEAIDFDKRNSA